MTWLPHIFALAAALSSSVGEAKSARTGPPGPASEPTLERKVGQMLLVGFRGTELEPDHWVLRAIERYALGGVVLYSVDVPTGERPRNISDPQQLRRLTARLHAAAGELPLFVAVDQEGGRVRRLGDAFSPASRPSAAQLGAANDEAATRAFSASIGQTLAAAGINMNFAPVVDLNTHPDNPAIGAHGRSFGSDPDRVVRHARAFIDGHRSHGVLTVLKHFPGHGSARSDSHRGWVDITGVWSERELDPFRRLVAGGLADAVMTAHVYHRGLDATHPATLSKSVIGLLRRQMGFNGVVVSDDLQMRAIRDAFGDGAAVRLAIEAGVDLLMFSNNSIYDPEVVPRVVAHVVASIRNGGLDPAVVDSAYLRITALKRTLARARYGPGKRAD